MFPAASSVLPATTSQGYIVIDSGYFWDLFAQKKSISRALSCQRNTNRRINSRRATSYEVSRRADADSKAPVHVHLWPGTVIVTCRNFCTVLLSEESRISDSENILGVQCMRCYSLEKNEEIQYLQAHKARIAITATIQSNYNCTV